MKNNEKTDKNDKRKRLALNKETLRQISEGDLRSAAGGISANLCNPSSPNVTCNVSSRCYSLEEWYC